MYFCILVIFGNDYVVFDWCLIVYKFIVLKFKCMVYIFVVLYIYDSDSGGIINYIRWGFGIDGSKFFNLLICVKFSV